MDRYRLIIAPRAALELGVIYDDIAADSEQNAVSMCTRIMDAIALLEEPPHRTIVAVQPPNAKYPVRSIAVWPYVVFFRVVDDDRVVRVIRIRHGARRPLKRFD